MSQNEGSRAGSKESLSRPANDDSTGRTTGSGVSSFGEMGSSTGNAAGSSTGVAGGFGSGTSGDQDVCPDCGQPLKSGASLDQFLGRLGITEEMVDNLKGQFQNVDIDEYLNTARDYLKDSGGKAQTYAKENPGKVAAGVAALALGAGLIYSKCTAMQDLEDRFRQLELKQALQGRKYRLDEVLRELDLTA